MRKIIVSILLSISFFYAIAQSDFRPGYIITNSMDTIHGLVDYRGDSRNMKMCTFKKSLDDSPKEYSPDEIYAYRYKSGKFYVTKEIKKNDVNQIVFVEYLLNGINNLYYYSSINYGAYFIESNKGELLELRRVSERESLERDGIKYTKKDYQYKGLLAYAFADYPEIQKDLAKAELSHKSLIQITKKYHEYKCTDEACIIYEKKMPIVSIEIKPLIGYSFTSLSIDNIELEKVDFQMSYSALVGVAFNFQLPRFNEKMSLLFNFTFNEDYFYASTVHEFNKNSKKYSYYHLNRTNFTSSIALKYTYPKGKYRPELFVGVYGNTILKNDSKVYKETLSNKVVRTEENEPELFDKFQTGIICGIGLEYKLFNKLRSFSNLTFQYGSNGHTSDIGVLSKSYKISTGLIF